jgi:hypothetical protein
VSLPPKVKDAAIAADEGKIAVGPGIVTIDVGPHGVLTGTVAGALGPGNVTGTIDGDALRAAIRPDDVHAAGAMTGVLIGQKKADAFACEIHVAGPDGTVIREATFTIERKK